MTPVPRSDRRMASASGIIRSTAGSSGLTDSVLTSVPPCATITAPRAPAAASMPSVSWTVSRLIAHRPLWLPVAYPRQ
jgi:hypothetical protein